MHWFPLILVTDFFYHPSQLRKKVVVVVVVPKVFCRTLASILVMIRWLLMLMQCFLEPSQLYAS
jgi:hypothetical protein